MASYIYQSLIKNN